MESNERNTDVILRAEHLVKQYPVRSHALLKRRKQVIHAVNDVSFALYRGQTLGLVGESGCGKSTIGRLLTGIEHPTGGTVYYQGMPLHTMASKELAGIRTQLQMIFQDPYVSLNPKKRVGDILGDPIRAHKRLSRAQLTEQIDFHLEEVGLPTSAKTRYPHELSGGQRQRIVIARALSLDPQVIVCDEPVSALDPSIQAQILNLLKELQQERGMTCLFITHGLAAVRYVSNRIAVMYLGRIVEMGEAQTLLDRPLHPYTRMLLSSVPIPDPQMRRRREEFVPTGEVPSADHIFAGCRFHDRCPLASGRCALEEPPLFEASAAEEPEHLAACWKINRRGIV